MAGKDDSDISLEMLVKIVVDEKDQHSEDDDGLMNAFVGAEYADTVLKILRKRHFEKVPVNA